MAEAEPTRVAALDGIRGTAALMVMAFHYYQGMPGFALGKSWLTTAARGLSIGQSGVDLFFVLSGFLITGILLNAKDSPYFLRNFYMRRALRILPLYYLVVVGCITVGWMASKPNYMFDKSWWYLLYLQNIGMTFWPGSVGEPGHFWSLGVEEHFYLIWPFLILAFSEKQLPKVLLLLIGSGIAIRALLLSLYYDVFTFSLCRMDALSMGALLAVLLRQDAIAHKVNRICIWTLVLLGPLLMALYPLLSGAALFWVQVVKYSLIALGYTALVGSVLGPGKVLMLQRLFSNRFLCWCGAYSYAMYVFHPFVYGFVMIRMRRMELLHSNPILFMAIELPVCAAVTFFVSWLSWHLMEKRVLNLKRYFTYKTDSRIAAPVVVSAPERPFVR